RGGLDSRWFALPAALLDLRPERAPGRRTADAQPRGAPQREAVAKRPPRDLARFLVRESRYRSRAARPELREARAFLDELRRRGPRRGTPQPRRHAAAVELEDPRGEFH